MSQVRRHLQREESTGPTRTPERIAVGNFLSFRWMVTPRIIQASFVVGTVAAVAIGCVLIGRGIRQHDRNLVIGLAVLILGPLALRIWCELMIVVFRINSTLTDIREQTASSA